MYENIEVRNISFKNDIREGYLILKLEVNGVTVNSDIVKTIKGWSDTLKQDENFIIARIVK